MNKEFIPYEQALELKELGFDETCLAWHNSGRLFIDNYNAINSKMDFDYCCALPLYQQAFRWFRDKYGIMYTVHNNIENWKNNFHGAYSKINSNYESDYTDDYATYEEAELECLKKLIKIVKNK
jgi:hypothetical protein